MNKKYLVFAVLMALLVIIIVNNMKQSGQSRVAELTYKTGTISSASAGIETNFPRIEKELLSPPAISFRMGKKAIFDPLEFPQKKIKSLPVVPPPLLIAEPISKHEPPSVIEKHVAKFIFLGFLESRKGKTIFLSKDDDVIIVKEGDVMLKKYLVKKITDNNVIITSVDDSESITISLVENEPLRKKR